MQLASGTHIPDGLLAANALLAENSRQGFGTWSSTAHQGSRVVISSTAIGISGTLYDSRIESRYTGKERDSESGNDYFTSRYYGSSMGRFTSPDSDDIPDPVPYAKFENPQSLNLYAYVSGNPVSRTDGSGHDVNVCSANGSCTEMTNDQYKAAQQANNGGLNVPSLNSVGTNGSGNITDANGNTVGTATYISDGNLDPFTQSAGFATLGAASKLVNYATVGATAAYGGAFLGPLAYGGLSGMGSSVIGLGVASGPAIFSAGQMFEHYFETNAGEVGVLAEVETSGSTLILKDIAVYPTGTSGSLNIGAGQVAQGINQLKDMARSQGFTSLQITGVRLTGANPGALYNRTWSLK
jgi:RHS repeat-associated protein